MPFFPLDVKIGEVLLKCSVSLCGFFCFFLMLFHGLDFSSMIQKSGTKSPNIPFSTPFPNYAPLTSLYYENAVRDCEVNHRKSNVS